MKLFKKKNQKFIIKFIQNNYFKQNNIPKKMTVWPRYNLEVVLVYLYKKKNNFSTTKKI